MINVLPVRLRLSVVGCSASPDLGEWGLRSGRQGHSSLVSCGFAALTLDCRSCDPGLAGHRVRPRCGQSPGRAGRCRLPNGCPQPRPRPWPARTGRASVAVQRRRGAGSGCRWWGRVCRRSRRTGAARPGESTSAAIRSTSGASIPAASRASRTTVARSARCSAQGLAGPVPGDQDAAAAAAEVLPVVRLAGAAAGDEAGSGLVGLDAVAQPVRAARASRAASAARRAAGRCAPPGPGVLSWSPSGSAMDLVRYLVRYRTARSASGEGAMMPAMSSWRAEPHHVRRLGVRVGVELVERLVPGGQHLAGVGVAVAVAGPDRLPVHVDRPVEGRPPQLHVGGLDHLLEHRAGDGAADRGVQMRREPGLGFDGGEVLHPVAGAPAQVLPEPVDQLREVQRIQRGPPVVIGRRVDRDPGARAGPARRTAG